MVSVSLVGGYSIKPTNRTKEKGELGQKCGRTHIEKELRSKIARIREEKSNTKIEWRRGKQKQERREDRLGVEIEDTHHHRRHRRHLPRSLRRHLSQIPTAALSSPPTSLFSQPSTSIIATLSPANPRHCRRHHCAPSSLSTPWPSPSIPHQLLLPLLFVPSPTATSSLFGLPLSRSSLALSKLMLSLLRLRGG